MRCSKISVISAVKGLSITPRRGNLPDLTSDKQADFSNVSLNAALPPPRWRGRGCTRYLTYGLSPLTRYPSTSVNTRPASRPWVLETWSFTTLRWLREGGLFLKDFDLNAATSELERYPGTVIAESQPERARDFVRLGVVIELGTAATIQCRDQYRKGINPFFISFNRDYKRNALST